MCCNYSEGKECKSDTHYCNNYSSVSIHLVPPPFDLHYLYKFIYKSFVFIFIFRFIRYIVK